jgi:hypothetical protein
MERDAEHLRLLSLFHYIRGGLSAFFSCFALIYVVMGVTFASTQIFTRNSNAPPAWFGLLLIFLGGAVILMCWTWAAAVIYAGRCLAHRKNRTYCMVIAGISCLFMPYGTILGVFTLIVLQRPTVKQMFDQPLLAR